MKWLHTARPSIISFNLTHDNYLFTILLQVIINFTCWHTFLLEVWISSGRTIRFSLVTIQPSTVQMPVDPGCMSVYGVLNDGCFSSFEFSFYSERPSNNQTAAVHKMKAASSTYLYLSAVCKNKTSRRIDAESSSPASRSLCMCELGSNLSMGLWKIQFC